jgi:hypothetical protein
VWEKVKKFLTSFPGEPGVPGNPGRPRGPWKRKKIKIVA